MKICVMCPTRDRPEAAVRMAKSLLATSREAELIFYIDGDQEALYTPHLEELNPSIDGLGRVRPTPRRAAISRVRALFGARLGSVHSSNLITHHYRDHRIYGMVPDDSEFLTPGWDRYLIERLDSEVPHCVAAAHDKGSPVNFPFVNRAWIESVGWYYYPKNHHHCCDTIVEMLGECANAITYATPEQFAMHHELLPTMNRDRVDGDAMSFLDWCIGERKESVRKLREAIVAALQPLEEGFA